MLIFYYANFYSLIFVMTNEDSTTKDWIFGNVNEKTTETDNG